METGEPLDPEYVGKNWSTNGTEADNGGSEVQSTAQTANPGLTGLMLH